MKYKDFYSHLITESTDIEIKLERLRQAGQTQRGIPEHVMDVAVKVILKSGGSAFFCDWLEHVGDISDRASRSNAIGDVYDKVNRRLRDLKENPDYMEYSMEISYEDNAIYKLMEESGFLKEFRDLADIGDRTRFEKLNRLKEENSEKLKSWIEHAKSVTKEECKKYVEVHKKHNLPITTLGRLGKQAAIDLGEMRFYDLIKTFKKIMKWLDEYGRSGYSDEKLLQGYDENRHDYIEGEEIEKEGDDVKI
jgi:ribosomal protein S8